MEKDEKWNPGSGSFSFDPKGLGISVKKPSRKGFQQITENIRKKYIKEDLEDLLRNCDKEKAIDPDYYIKEMNKKIDDVLLERINRKEKDILY